MSGRALRSCHCAGWPYNVWLTRGIRWHDDYYPLQDPFFYSVALAMLVATWTLLQQDGDWLLRRLVGVVLVGAVTNVAFGLWQMATGKGWWGQLPYVHECVLARPAFVRRLHGRLPDPRLRGAGDAYNNPKMKTLPSGVAMLASAVGLYLSGSRSTLLLALALLIGWVIWATPKLRGLASRDSDSRSDRSTRRDPLGARSRLSRNQLRLAA